ncbi:MAG: hypothetical protein JJ900_18175 [Rhodospirillales bacterium]|nr:hypothetical protein [Rhodospirillales bacterium]MBO6788780.1 hypothetical protein [Rhodospirillales bacterium]
MKRVLTVLGAFTALFAVSASPVQAAPQILAVMASLGPQQMNCAGSICTTSLSSYCLQRERDVPTTGQAYMPASDQQFSLVVIDGDGNERTVDASKHVEFRSVRGYSSVNATIGKAELAKLGGVSAKIVVAARAALVPEPVEGDPNPISAEELAYAAKSLREHGEEVVDAQPAAEAAAIVNRLAATIIPRMKADGESLEQLWRDVIDGLGPARPANAEGIRKARDIYDWCQGRMSYHSMGGIKSCLEFKHDEGIMRLNTDYWESQPGY